MVGNPSFRPRAEVARGKKTSPILQSKRKSRAQSPPPTSIIIQVPPRFMHIPSFPTSADRRRRRRRLGGGGRVKMLRTLGRRSVEENVGPAGLASEVDIRGRRRRVRESPKYLYTYRTITSHTIGELWISATAKIIVHYCVGSGEMTRGVAAATGIRPPPPPLLLRHRPTARGRRRNSGCSTER